MSDRTKIGYLPQDVAFKIGASVLVKSLADVAVGLMRNALDAQAGKIWITLDLERGGCTVEDDGVGIPTHEFLEDGKLGNTYLGIRSSDSSWDISRKGSGFLASVAALALVRITSQHTSSTGPSTMTVLHSTCLSRLIYDPENRRLKTMQGTYIMVQDLFGSMPVRLKQRALELKRGANKELMLIKSRLIGLLLAWHRPVVLRVCVINQDCPILSVRINRSVFMGTMMTGPSPLESTEYLENVMVHEELVHTILLQSGYMPPAYRTSWTLSSAQTELILLRAVINLVPVPTKHAQFISVGSSPLNSDLSSDAILDTVNTLFAASTFGSLSEDHHDADVNDGTSKPANNRADLALKGPNRWPMFYLRICTRNQGVKDISDNHVLTKVLEMVNALFHQFLQDNNFTPRRGPGRFGLAKPSDPHVSRPLSSINAFASWRRVKYGKLAPCQAKPLLPPDCNIGKVRCCSHDQGSRTNAKRPDCHENERVLATKGADEDDFFEWTDPLTRELVYINSRTGHVKTTKAHGMKCASSIANSKIGVDISDQDDTDRSISRSVAPVHESAWASDILAAWKNPTFAPTETPITQTSTVEFMQGLHCNPAATCQSDEPGTVFALAPSGADSSVKLSKLALGSARVICQVNQQMILVQLNDDAQTLALVDQHAADERVRVESLLRDVQQLPPINLVKLIEVQIQSQDQEVLQKSQSYFAKWGICYNMSVSNKGSRALLSVHTLPQVIAARCVKEHRILSSLLLTEAWLRESESRTATSQIPQGLLDMLNSRACRSAIMFNDPLSVQECENLVSRLAGTKMPFQCAHGRPSMVPILSLGVKVPQEHLDRAEETSLGHAWKQWTVSRT